jgi:predicted transposase/invertase (TIGR01784 family)
MVFFQVPEMSVHWIDRAWKDVINENADDVISFFMPELAAERDHAKKPESANPVHETIGGDSDKGSRISDVCFSVPLISGYASRAVFLIEQQDKNYKSLPLRIFQSFYRASDEFQAPVTALAIFTGTEEPINTYFMSYHGTEVNFKYNICCVRDADAEKLKLDKRDFALAILAGKRMSEAAGNPGLREKFSLELLDLLEKRGMNSEKTWSFKNFVYRILQIGKDDIDSKVRGVWKMRFRPIDEVIYDIRMRDAREAGIEEGIEKGIERGKFEVAKNLLAYGVPVDVIAKSSGLSPNDLQGLMN